ncbi:unnamed protein product [Didymodactylos carnosus]|uniref:Uncharacterized protein n=1 Tax=Didymodactylos carnosus TaxID=1234261 RepID=A0A8S2G120_9BILA|nr:unnamed protein product [Didymodactylos carnosus]CAF4411793.1 unnamed protein product [Didymodactylos carnosus]
MFFGYILIQNGILHIEKDPDSLIITIDDDCLYHPSTFAYLIGTVFNLPWNLIPAFLCETYNPRSKIWTWRSTRGKCYGILAAFGSVIYRRRDIDDTIFNYTDVPRSCYIHDDIYISGHLYRKHIRSYTIGRGTGLLDFGIPWSMKYNARRPNMTIGGLENMKELKHDCIRYFNYFR